MSQQDLNLPDVTSGGNWKKHDWGWMIRQEKIRDGAWLCCFKRPDGYNGGPYGWVHVFSEMWKPNHTPHLECVEIFSPMGLLELECIAENFREKYK